VFWHDDIANLLLRAVALQQRACPRLLHRVGPVPGRVARLRRPGVRLLPLRAGEANGHGACPQTQRTLLVAFTLAPRWMRKLMPSTQPS
jgi:hypothetical protein